MALRGLGSRYRAPSTTPWMRWTSGVTRSKHSSLPCAWRQTNWRVSLPWWEHEKQWIRCSPHSSDGYPKVFKGSQVAEDVDNFFWSMDDYFREVGSTVGAMHVTTASMRLADVALLWWRCRLDEQSGELIHHMGTIPGGAEVAVLPTVHRRRSLGKASSTRA